MLCNLAQSNFPQLEEKSKDHDCSKQLLELQFCDISKRLLCLVSYHLKCEGLRNEEPINVENKYKIHLLMGGASKITCLPVFCDFVSLYYCDVIFYIKHSRSDKACGEERKPAVMTSS